MQERKIQKIRDERRKSTFELGSVKAANERVFVVGGNRFEGNVIERGGGGTSNSGGGGYREFE